MTQLRIPAVYMRGGTSKGVFFLAGDLPADPVKRDRILLRVIGSPDRYGQHIDGMGGATSSTSKVVIVSRSCRPDSDVDYLFGQVPINASVIDWSGNCGNLTSAVGPFAISSGLVHAPADGVANVRIWQANIGKKIVAKVQMQSGLVREEGEFELDGVTFPAAEVKLEFLDPGADDGELDGRGMFPSGARIETLDVPGVGKVEVTLINAGNPTIFVAASALGLVGTELPSEVNSKPDLLVRVEAIRAQGAVAMGLVASAIDATSKRPHTPKLAFFAKPANYFASDGKAVDSGSIDILARIFSMGKLHHAMTGTGAIAIAAAAAIPGTLVFQVASPIKDVQIRFGHPSGSLSVGAELREEEGRLVVSNSISNSLM